MEGELRELVPHEARQPGAVHLGGDSAGVARRPERPAQTVDVPAGRAPRTS